jgi:hypothetical protein
MFAKSVDKTAQGSERTVSNAAINRSRDTLRDDTSNLERGSRDQHKRPSNLFAKTSFCKIKFNKNM